MLNFLNYNFNILYLIQFAIILADDSVRCLLDLEKLE